MGTTVGEFIVASKVTHGLWSRSLVSGAEFYGPAAGLNEVVVFPTRAAAEAVAAVKNGYVVDTDAE